MRTRAHAVLDQVNDAQAALQEVTAVLRRLDRGVGRANAHLGHVAAELQNAIARAVPTTTRTA